jgi:RNA polymerase sigma-70 factor, ECF subfamily
MALRRCLQTLGLLKEQLWSKKQKFPESLRPNPSGSNPVRISVPPLLRDCVIVRRLRSTLLMNLTEPIAAPRRLVAVPGGRAHPARTYESMQELILIQPIRAAETEWAREAATAATRREFEERLAECGPLAFRIALGVLRNTADAEDVAQEALLRAYRQFDRLRDRQRFRSWLVRIAFRLALDRARSAKRREQREILWAQPVPDPTTEDLAASSEFQSHLARAVEQLSPKLRLVLLLAAMEGHTTDEVAALLGLPIGTVKSRLFFARKQLAEKLRCHVKNTKTR